MTRAHPAWAAPYIGARYKKGGRTLAEGLDCIGLFLLTEREAGGFDLPEYDGPPWEGSRSVRALGRAAEAFASRFIEISAGSEQAFDAVLLRSFRQPVHIGLVTSPGFMLHIEEGCDAVIESYRSVHWKNRIAGFYRPHLKAEAAA